MPVYRLKRFPCEAVEALTYSAGLVDPFAYLGYYFMISLECPICNKQINLKDEVAGKEGKCPGCGQPIVVPALAVAARQVVKERTLPPSMSPGGEDRTLPPKNPGQAEKESLSDAEGQTALGADRKGQQTQSLPAEGPSPHLLDFLAPAQKPDEIGRLGPYC